MRLPTALIGPGFVGGGEIREIVSLLDLPPTLLDAAGLPLPKQMQGRSVVPLVNRQAPDWPQETLIQISESQVGRAVHTHRWKYGVTAPDKDGRRDVGSDRYVEEYLYDLQADPYELTNLVGLESHRQAADVLRDRLLRCMVEAGEPAAIIEPAPARPGGQRIVTEAEALA